MDEEKEGRNSGQRFVDTSPCCPKDCRTQKYNDPACKHNFPSLLPRDPDLLQHDHAPVHKANTPLVQGWKGNLNPNEHLFGLHPQMPLSDITAKLMCALVAKMRKSQQSRSKILFRSVEVTVTVKKEKLHMEWKFHRAQMGVRVRGKRCTLTSVLDAHRHPSTEF